MTKHILNDLPQQKVSGSIMKHPLVGTARCLTGMALVLLGLSIYGCGDSGTATQPAELGNLSVSVGDLQPAFSPAITSYTLQLPTDVPSTTITATPRVAGDSIRIDNQQVGSQTITLDSPGAEKSVNIVVTETGTGGTSKSYIVQVKRATLAGNNSLASLTVSSGILAPEFDKSSTRYTVSVDNNVSRVTITPTLSDPAATMTVNGQSAISGQPRAINLTAGNQTTTITITVTAQNGNTQSYEIVVSSKPSNNLQGLTVSPGPLVPAFRASGTGYTVNVGSGVGSVTIRPTLADTRAAMTVNGQAATSGQSQTITLNQPGSPTIITIFVIVPEVLPKQYSVTINRAALGGNNNLSALAVTPGPLDSPFNANDLSYTVNVGSGIDSVRVRPTLADPAATMTVNGQPTTSGQQSAPITLNPAGQATSIQIVVTAQNQTATKNYSVVVVRAALGANSNLSALTVTPGTLDSPFSANDVSYIVNVDSAVGNVTVSATKEDPNAVLLIGPMSIPAGTPSGGTIFPLNGAGGAPTPISVTVTAQNQVNTTTYTLSVIRPTAPTPPAKPATAPDLLQVDDSCQFIPGTSTCFPPTSDTDNKTNVKRPGFSVATPGPGETAKVYIKKTTGEEFLSSSTPAGNTLIFRPNVDLADGFYDVTYTISNSVGESDRSPVMTPQLEINTIISN